MYASSMILTALIIAIVILMRYHFLRLRAAERRAVTYSPNAILTLDDLGQLQGISKNAVEWFDHPREALLGLRLDELFDNQSEIAEAMRDVSEQRDSKTRFLTARRLTADKRELTIEAAVVTNHDPSLPYAFVATLRDISREVELQKGKQTLIERSHSRVLVQNEQWDTLLCSDAWIEFTGYSREETVSRDFQQFLHPDDRRRRKSDREKILKGIFPQADQETPYRIITKSGETKVVRLRSLVQQEGMERQLLLFIIDVTEIEEARQRAEGYLKAGTSLYAVQDESFNFVYLSDSLVQRLGYSNMSEVPHATRLHTSADSDVDSTRSKILALPLGAVYRYPSTKGLHHAAGFELRFRMTCRWFLSFDGKTRLLMTGLEDVTELEMANTQLAEAHKAAKTLLAANVNIYTVQDEDFNYVYVSESCLALLGVASMAEMPPLHSLSAALADVTLADHRVSLRALETDKIYRSDAPEIVKTPDGREHHLRRTRRWFLAPDGKSRLLLNAFEDLTELVEQQAELERTAAERDRLTRAATAYLEAGTTLFFVRDEDYKLLYMSEQLLELFEYEKIEDVPPSREWRVDNANVDAVRAIFKQAPIGQVQRWPDLVRLRTRSGKVITVQETYRWFQPPSSDQPLLITGYEDVTELLAERSFNEMLLDKSPAVILTEDSEFKIASCSEAWTQMMGYSREETVGQDIVSFMAPELREAVLTGRKKFAKGSEVVREFRSALVAKDGKRLNVTMNARIDTSSPNWRVILTVMDVTDFVRIQKTLRHLAEHDELTGLLSRRGLKERFGAGRRDKKAGIFLLDIDHFKSVNDTYGHEAGDRLLQAFADTLTRLAGAEGRAIRLGGEEFAVIRNWSSWSEANKFAEQMRQELKDTSIELEGRRVQRTASIGYAFLPPDGDLSRVLHIADIVQQEAKLTGRNKAIGASKNVLAQLEARGAFITTEEVKRALHDGDLNYVVQPVWDVSEKKPAGFEALIRWQRADGKTVMPALFVGLLREVLRDPISLHQMHLLWRETLAKLKPFPDSYVAFNFVLEQLSYKGAGQDLIKQIEEIKDHPDRKVVIELSEQALHDRVDQSVLREELTILRNHGYLIALDDFGVESSNLNRLQDFPIDIVKLDKILIRDLATSSVQRITLRGIAATLLELGVKVVAEGIETEEQAAFLEEMGISLQQGFLHGRPMPPETVKCWSDGKAAHVGRRMPNRPEPKAKTTSRSAAA